MNYKAIIQKKQTDYKNASLLKERDFNNLLKEHPKLNDIEYNIKQILIDKECGIKIDAKKLTELQKNKDDFLKKIGLSSKDFIVSPSCKKCTDTGYDKNKICSCVVASLSLAPATISFNDFDINIFDKLEQEFADKALAKSLEFCKEFPNTKKLNLLLLGKTGTGKTFLAKCIADDLQKKGFGVVFTSAFGFLNKTLQYHTTFDEHKYSHIAPFLDCDLLIIDDLGTENMLKNVTIEYLYHILNERIQKNMHTIITTNLDNKEIADRYDERIFSRLFDKKLSDGFAISAKDLRRN
ncbi:MAG: ATP-binding protein [Firmicutes bacterium]|nr:ATP-binding protein [Bacillota bacterium]